MKKLSIVLLKSYLVELPSTFNGRRSKHDWSALKQKKHMHILFLGDMIYKYPERDIC